MKHAEPRQLEDPCWTSTADLLRSVALKAWGEGICWTSTTDLCIEGRRERAMLNLNGWSGPWALRWRWLNIFSDLDEASDEWIAAGDIAWGEETCWTSTADLVRWASRWRPEGKSHAEPQRLIWSGRLRVEDAWTFLSDAGEASDGWTLASRAWKKFRTFSPRWLSFPPLRFCFIAIVIMCSATVQWCR